MNNELKTGSTCLVTGGAGFIGSHLVSTLVDHGCSVRVLDNLSTGYFENLSHLQGKVDFIEGDAADPRVARAAVSDVDYVFHHAAMASVPRSLREPALCHAWCTTSTVELLAASAESGVKRFVFASTSAAYGNSSFVSKRETDPPAPLSPYAAAKLASEDYCQAYFNGLGFETVCLRYFNVFGPRQDPKSEYSAVIPRFVAMLLAGESPIVYGDGGQSRDFVFVEDVVQANLLAATVQGAAGGIFNVGRGNSTTLLMLLDYLRELLEKEIRPIFQPARVGDVRESLADISHTRRVLGYEPEVTIREGLEKSIAYYRQIVKKSNEVSE